MRTPPSYFTNEELRAWGGFLKLNARITTELSLALESSLRLRLVEYEVLLKLATSPEGSLPMSRLAERSYLTLSQSGLSRLVERLRSRGLLTRETCETGDRRSVMVTITPQGRALWEKASADHAARVRELFLNQLEPEELSGLGDLWQRVLARYDME
ncbi:MarR family winged helix-turn-helix transcriptional regulator [Arthrobacter zhaoguopingii]|uniref:MarR family winged helix-turn-helix transcriptional regulator n=1 Tax=Arthrobacter zhaoguopingii TaxID=2681491 RepID=UPI00135C6BBF|nr:MarR family transcriptional regulator [Arthrobacter zhaoguopingii]